MPTPTILFVATFPAPFIQDDLETLERHFRVRRQIGHGAGAAVKIAYRVFSADVIFCWFASVYAFVAVAVGRLFSIKSVVVVGGVDAAKDATIGYGIWLSRWRAPLIRYVFRHADTILVVDPSLGESAKVLARYNGTNMKYLPTGYDTEFWKPMGEKEPLVLTVALVRDAVTLRRKGLDLLVEAARRLPAVRFLVVGLEPALVSLLMPPANMTVYAPMPRKDVLQFYRSAKVYCQPSRWEGLPNSLCEAMACGCIPVASDVCGNPTAVGDTGFLVPVGETDPLVEAIQRALRSENRRGEAARARIVSLFPRQRRESELVKIVEEAAA